MYRRSYLCVCTGRQEELYLKHIAKLLKKTPGRVVTFNTIIGDATRLEKTYTEYDNAALFDHDFKENEFIRNIQLCDRLNRNNRPTKRKNGRYTYHAYSNVNFDLWLILHKEEYNRPVSDSKAYVADVRRVYRLGCEEDIKSEVVIRKILSQISLNDVKDAISRACRIREGKLDGDRMIIGSSYCYPNPDFSIHNFLMTVLRDCNELQ